MASPQKSPKSLGLKPPKAEKPGDIPTIRKLATLKQYGLLNGISPGFSPADRFFQQRPLGLRELRGYEGYVELRRLRSCEEYRHDTRVFAQATVCTAETQAAVMHKRKSSANGGALYDGCQWWVYWDAKPGFQRFQPSCSSSTEITLSM
ncbi:MAG: hypothetical protein H6Q72_1683 [Firmicutes bacterium]|nr:hypothetical protein [Bacillota bacterium]